MLHQFVTHHLVGLPCKSIPQSRNLKAAAELNIMQNEKQIMSSSHFKGTSQELILASQLMREEIVVSTPLIDIGVDLIASNKEFSKSIPIQVKYKAEEKNIFFTGKEIDSYSEKNVYIAYYLANNCWYMPFEYFLKMAERPQNRKDKAAYIRVKDNMSCLDQYAGHKGFSLLLRAIKNE